jgi:phenylpropionate dioxygenase-like ring-hydroxylating dioxygenase large terminal subunit
MMDDTASADVDGEDAGSEESSGAKFNWQKAWYPLAVVQDLDPGRPTKLELLGEDLVAWRDGAGVWRVFEDRCPHRNVPLSEGRVEKDGTLLCSYHGWRFNGEGRVTAIPQAKAERLPVLKTNPRGCASTRPTQVRLGVLWVWGETSEHAAEESARCAPNLPPEAEDPALRDRLSFSVWSHRDLPYGWEVAMENVTDPSHVFVAHHNTTGNRYTDPSPLELAWVREPSNEGGFKFTITRLVPPKKGEEGTIATMDFRPPCQMHIKTLYPSGASLTLVINFVPTKPGWSRLVGSTMMVKGVNGEKPAGFALFSAPLPRWIVHLLGPSFLHQDSVFLHFQQSILHKAAKRGKTWAKSYWMPTAADKGTVALRRWLDRNGGVAWGSDVSTDVDALPQKELLFDTYKTHTSQCVTCTKALKRTGWVETALKYSALVAGSAGVTTANLPLLSAGALAGAGSIAAGKVKKMFYEVPFHHQDND